MKPKTSKARGASRAVTQRGTPRRRTAQPSGASDVISHVTPADATFSPISDSVLKTENLKVRAKLMSQAAGLDRGLYSG